MPPLIRPIVCACAALLAASAPAGAQEFDCMIEARQAVEIRSPVEAVIEQVHVKRGDTVTRGQLLVTLAAGPERAQLELAQSRARMQGEIKSAEARLDIAQKKAQRSAELFKQSFISANARDESQAELQLATEELRRVRETQKLNELEARRAYEVVAMRSIRSPLAGVVVEVMLKPGEFGAITFKDPIMKLAQIDPLHVEVVLPVSQYGQVKAGQKASVMPEAPVGGRYETRVALVDKVVDAASGTFGVRLELRNRKFEIPAGVRCRVQFQ
ncbi:MAG TPA: efflux RND transporter periplasmic adaptor subunit [Burkholderiales bacterium]|nr:efflux RND transporter periplasmic adaptor subunit [Burkholderiales bacterium]